MTWDEYASAWAGLHGGFDPRTASPLVRGWVRLAYRGGSVLGRWRVTPTVVTGLGLVLCVLVPVAVLGGRGWLLLGGLLVLLASVADGLDGAVAVVTRTTSRIGFVYDSAADRLGEGAWLVALWLAGAPPWLALAAGAVSWLHEYVRARAAVAGLAGIGVVTVGERPSRVAIAVSTLVVGGLASLILPGLVATVATIGAAGWLLFAVVGLSQLVAVVRRRLS